MTVHVDRPIFLSADRFTPLQKTPWAGSHIIKNYKSHLGLTPLPTHVGESWEFSCDPEFPSLLVGDQSSLIDLVEKFPREILSSELLQHQGAYCAILLKLLNADSPLSVQVHPTDNDMYLKAHECGKPESWYVLSARSGCGLYIGFKDRLDHAMLERLLLEKADLTPYLNFIEVSAGDYFEIEPGVVHAIGPGVTLLEPQRIHHGKSGKTYRLWDWGRKYNDKGELDPLGKERELHVESALRILNFDLLHAPTLMKTIQKKPLHIQTPQGHDICEYPANPYYQLRILEMSSSQALCLTIEGGYGVVLCLEGSLKFPLGLPERIGKANPSVWGGPSTAFGKSEEALVKGRTCLLPHASFPLEIQSDDRKTRWALIQPATAIVAFAKNF